MMRRIQMVSVLAVGLGLVFAVHSLRALGAPPAAPGAERGVAAPAPAGPTEQAASERPKPGDITLVYLIRAGGPLMYPIELCSVIALAFIIERLVRLRRARVMPPAFMASMNELVRANGGGGPGTGLDLCRRHPSPAARIFEHAFKKAGRPHAEIHTAVDEAGEREVGRLTQNVRVLSVVANVAPLLGLLGTVTGIIKAFIKVHTESGMGKPELLAAGIYEALVTTAAGLFVAIPAVVMYHYFTHKSDKMVRELDALAVDLIEVIGVPAK